MEELDYLTTAQVCARLRVDRSTLTRWVGAERIAAAMKLPGPRGAFLFSPAEVQRVQGELAGATTGIPEPRAGLPAA